MQKRRVVGKNNGFSLSGYRSIFVVKMFAGATSKEMEATMAHVMGVRLRIASVIAAVAITAAAAVPILYLAARIIL